MHVTSVHVWSDTRIFHRMCRSLAGRGWQVLLVAPGNESRRVESVDVVGIRTPGWRVLRALIGGYRAVSTARKLDGDIYHLHDAELLLWAWLLRRTGRPVIYDMHEFVPAAISTRRWIPSFARRLLAASWRGFEKLALRDTPVVFAETSYSRHYPWIRRSVVVLNLPDVQALISLNPAKATHNRIVYVGAVSASRGSVVTLKAIRILQDRGVDVEFDCVGRASPEHGKLLEQLASQWSLKGVRFHGYKPPVDAWRIASGAAAGLAVLEPAPNYVESYPTKIFEYMALRLPVIVSDFPLYRDVVQGNDCGTCVAPGDAVALADAIGRLVADPRSASRLGDNGRNAVLEKYRWEPQLEVLESFYDALTR